MPIQDYLIYTKKGYAGDRFDSAPSVTQTGIVEDPILGYGLGVTPGTLSARHVIKGHDAGNVYGISMRELNHESATKPSDGTVNYLETESASIMREGFILVEVSIRACVAHELLNIADVGGQFSGGTAAAGETQTLNVTSLESGEVGEIIKARIDIYNA